MTILVTIITLVSIGVITAVILYLVAQKFKVYENPKIDEVEEALPGANCGGCGFPGCRGMAEALVNTEDISKLFCPVGGNDTMAKVAKILGKEVIAKDPLVAVVRCNGNFENRKRTNQYDGTTTCTMAASLYGGDTACEFGCLGLGDCVEACNFDAIHMDLTTGLPVVDQDNCTACGACVEACPRDIIELRRKGPKDRRIFVSCVNQDKGAVAMKACKTACIGCGKCFNVCAFDAITIENNLAYIDHEKCKLCRKCVAVCPTGAIHEINFPVKKAVVKPEEKKQTEESKENTNKTSENK